MVHPWQGRREELPGQHWVHTAPCNREQGKNLVTLCSISFTQHALPPNFGLILSKLLANGKKNNPKNKKKFYVIVELMAEKLPTREKKTISVQHETAFIHF